jgi:hypothetical protein
MVDLDENTKDLYEVWFSYLIRTPLFQTYLVYLRSGVSIYQSGDAPSGLAEFTDGYYHWFYPLLPGLWTHNPTDDDFSSIWNAWTRRHRRVRGDFVRDFPWEDIQDLAVRDSDNEIEGFVEEHKRPPGIDEIKALVSGQIKRAFDIFKNPDRLLLWIDPFGAQLEEIKNDLEFKISMARGHMKNTGVCFETTCGSRYNSPVAMERDSKARGLDALKRQLNLLSLEQAGYCRRSIASGCFSIEELPYGPEPLRNVLSTYTILERQSALEKSGDAEAFCKKLTPDEVTEEVALSLRKELQAAKKTLHAVQDGWFPRRPQISENQNRGFKPRS